MKKFTNNAALLWIQATRPRTPTLLDRFILPVVYSMSIELMIAVTFLHDRKKISSFIASFPIKGEGFVEYEAMLIHPNRKISREDAIDLIQKEDTDNPWEPAKTEHLLVFAAKFPDVQREYPIVALGSIAEVEGCLAVLVLGVLLSKRNLFIHRIYGDFISRCRFLAVRRKKIS